MKKYKNSKETYNKLISVSTELFYKNGFENTKIREICRQANVNHSLIYYYFPNGKYDLANKLIENHKKKCLQAIRKHFKTDDYLLFTLVTLRFTTREILQNEKEIQFYIEAWSKIRPQRPLIIENYTAALQQSLAVDSVIVQRATIIGDSVWTGLYNAKSEGIIDITHKEIRDSTDIARWVFMGLSLQKTKSFIKEAEKIVESIPIQDICIFDIKDDINFQ